ncbi:uncharacterized protein DEA37_0012282 [Paragonimus westermani]|uniref:Uncharacterized protein n=1 Tax=Paragonimus westermani TaxID=34504 RepID=A0A5J4NRZ1_9TREM|nr:uncharacterized protein DEA37_0012282 [Paragonimus westermani]
MAAAKACCKELCSEGSVQLWQKWISVTPINLMNKHHSIPPGSEYNDDLRELMRKLTRRLLKAFGRHLVELFRETGCRDRLLKLSTQIQNTWAKQDVKLRVRRAWTQPPPQPTPQTSQNVEEDHKVVDGSLRYPSEAESYSVAHQSWNTPHDFKKPHPSVLTDNSYSAEPDALISGSTGVKKGIHTPIVDMTPEMMVDQPDVPRRKPGRLSSHTALSYQPQRPKHSQWTPWKSPRFPPRYYHSDHHARYRTTNTDNSNSYAGSWSARAIRYPRDLSINNASIVVIVYAVDIGPAF